VRSLLTISIIIHVSLFHRLVVLDSSRSFRDRSHDAGGMVPQRFCRPFRTLVRKDAGGVILRIGTTGMGRRTLRP